MTASTNPLVSELQQWLTIEEAASVARRTPNAMRHLRKRNLGPRFVKVDGRLLCRRDDLVAWLEGDEA